MGSEADRWPGQTDQQNPEDTPDQREWEDFRLLLLLFAAFRLSSVLFFRPGGYIRDYADLIIYLQRASWQEYGLLPFRDYWSEYPPLFPWLSVAIDRFSRSLPLWEDDRLWFAALFGLVMVTAEVITFICIYRLARRSQPAYALRVAWMYAGLFLPVYLLGGWFDGLAVLTIFLALVVVEQKRTWTRALLFGLVAGIGGLVKIVPLAVLAVAPLAFGRWRERVAGPVLAIVVFAAGYAGMFLLGPVMTLASLRSLIERSGWSTLYALGSGFNRLGKVVGDPFDPAADVSLYEPLVPHHWVLALVLCAGLALLIGQYHREPRPQSTRALVSFAGLTYALLLLAYPAWNPQYALYLLPFIVLILPDGRGLLYALSLSALVLWEHPVHFNLIDAGYSDALKQLIDVDYRQLLEPIVVARTLVLGSVALDFGLLLFDRSNRERWLPVAATLLALLIAVASLPRAMETYGAVRLAASDLRPLILYLDSTDHAAAIVTQQQELSRELRPLLTGSRTVALVGGRPGRVDPLPDLVEKGPFIYLQTPEDGPAVLTYLDAHSLCPERREVGRWHLWYCNGYQGTELATFEDGLTLENAQLPRQLDESNLLTLFWRSDGQTARDYTVFVHILDATGRLIGQWDQPPGGEAAPTSQWREGITYIDAYRIETVEGGTAPFTIVAGLYDPATGDRLPITASSLAGDGSFVELATFPGP